MSTVDVEINRMMRMAEQVPVDDLYLINNAIRYLMDKKADGINKIEEVDPYLLPY